MLNSPGLFHKSDFFFFVSNWKDFIDPHSHCGVFEGRDTVCTELFSALSSLIVEQTHCSTEHSGSDLFKSLHHSSGFLCAILTATFTPNLTHCDSCGILAFVSIGPVLGGAELQLALQIFLVCISLYA